MKTINFGPFLGVNNRLPDTMLRVATSQLNGQYLRVADNVDIDNAGRIRRRNATQIAQAMTGAHSLHMVSATEGVLVRAGVLYAITLPTYTEVLLKTLSSNDAMTYVSFAGDLYYSNGVDSGRITSGVSYPLGIATPTLASALTIIGGSLELGWYQVAVSYSNTVTGEESGLSASENITLTTLGGLRVALPGATPGADTINVYISSANGEVPMYHGSVSIGTSIYDCTTLATGREANGRFEEKLPAGELFMSNGRLCSFYGNTVYVGQAFRPGYYLPLSGYIPFPAEITLAVENQGGTYVCADRTYFIPGDIGNVQEQMREMLPYGAVRGTVFSVPHQPVVGWFGAKGVVLADTQGQVVATSEENVDVEILPSAGSSAIVQSDGYRRVVSCGYCVNLENRAVSTYSDWVFTSVSGKYGTRSDGIYDLNAEGLVNAVIGFGKQNFGTEVLKRLPTTYIGVDSESPMNLTAVTPDQGEYNYDARSSGADTRVQRIDSGKGLRANWYDLTLRNTDGADFILTSVSFAPAVSQRRI